MARLLSLLLPCLAALCAEGGFGRPSMHPPRPFGATLMNPLPSTANCSVNFIDQPVDHFSFSAAPGTTFKQRYYVYDAFYSQKKAAAATSTTTPPPIFFYTGNEADVGLYVNATGLMWENGQAFGALLVFAEHRAYGASALPGQQVGKPHPYLSHELALADYVVLIAHLRQQYKVPENAAVVSFGGSYGGKLSAWIRMKYPATIAGAVSGSAPLLAFPGEAGPAWDSQSYYRVVTRTAAHYSANCAANVRAVFPLLDQAGRTAAGRAGLQRAFGLCKPVDEAAVRMLRYFVRDAFDSIAMGNYPWPSNYIAGTQAKPMPAWPMKEACSFLTDGGLAAEAAQAVEAAASRTTRATTTDSSSTTSSSSSSSSISSSSISNNKLFPAIRQAVSVLYNVSQDKTCFDLPSYPTPASAGAPMDGMWDWQWCTEQLPDSYWFTTDGKRDMFWDNPMNTTLVDEHCRLYWAGTTPRRHWIVQEYGGRSLAAGHSNIVFSSGGFDGWSSGGVATNFTDQSLYAVLIPDGGHHLDLMFSHADDPPSVRAVRKFEMEQVAKWIAERAAQGRAQSWGDVLQHEEL